LQTEVVEKLITHFIYSRIFAQIVPGTIKCRKVWYSRTGHRWQYNVAHALCMPGN